VTSKRRGLRVTRNVVILNEVKNLLLVLKPRPFAALRVTEKALRVTEKALRVTLKR